MLTNPTGFTYLLPRRLKVKEPTDNIAPKSSHQLDKAMQGLELSTT
jgi:hypothetical protein